MAKSGAKERVGSGAATRAALIGAARRTLIEEGFSRTSARAIATRAGCSQGSPLLPLLRRAGPAASGPGRDQRAAYG